MAQIVAILSRIIFQNELQRSGVEKALEIETGFLSPETKLRKSDKVS
jgi:hypothetical protein